MNRHVLAAMLRRAGTMTLLVYATHALAGVLLSAPLGADFTDALARNLFRARLAADDGALLLELGARRLPGSIAWSVGCVAAYAALAPLLNIAWSSAMSTSSGVRASLERGLRRYPAALALRICTLLGSAAVIAGAAALLALALSLSQFALSPGAEDAARAVAALVAGGGLLLLACVHDLASSTLAVSALSLMRALALGFRATSPRVLVARALSALAVLACFIAAEAVARSAGDALPPTAALVLSQALVFAATLLRGGWLALALDTADTHLRIRQAALSAMPPHAEPEAPLS